MKSILQRFSKPELDFFTENCMFTDEEVLLLNMVAREKSETEIAVKMNISESSVTKKKRRIFQKMVKFVEELEEMTTLYVNGKRVTKDELKNYEIKIDRVKKMLADKLTKKK